MQSAMATLCSLMTLGATSDFVYCDKCTCVLIIIANIHIVLVLNHYVFSDAPACFCVLQEWPHDHDTYILKELNSVDLSVLTV